MMIFIPSARLWWVAVVERDHRAHFRAEIDGNLSRGAKRKAGAKLQIFQRDISSIEKSGRMESPRVSPTFSLERLSWLSPSRFVKNSVSDRMTWMPYLFFFPLLYIFWVDFNIFQLREWKKKERRTICFFTTSPEVSTLSLSVSDIAAAMLSTTNNFDANYAVHCNL